MKRHLISTMIMAGIVVGFASAGASSAKADDVLVVTETNDGDDGTCDGHCTLREAINAANSSSDFDLIVFAGNGKKTYALTDGQIEIKSDLMIDGGAANQTVISGLGNIDGACVGNALNNTAVDGRIFEITGGSTSATIKNVTLADATTVSDQGTPFGCSASKSGACVRVLDATASFSKVQFTRCQALCAEGVDCSIDAGALSNRKGTVFIYGSTFEDNYAEDDAGAVQSGEPRVSGVGGRPSDTFIVNSEFRFNTAGHSGGALLNRSANGPLIIHDSLFFKNLAVVNGGAIENEDHSTAGIVANSDFNNNTCEGGDNCGGAIHGADGLTLDNNDFVHNTPDDVVQ